MVEEREVEVGQKSQAGLGLWPPAPSGPMGSRHLMRARLPASSEPRDQGNLILCSSGYFCGEGGRASCWFPQQQSLAELHCADRPAGRGGGGRKGGASPSRARPSQRRWEQEPWVTGGRGCLEGPGPSPEKKSRKGPVGMRGLLVDGLKGKEVLERGQ